MSIPRYKCLTRDLYSQHHSEHSECNPMQTSSTWLAEPLLGVQRPHPYSTAQSQCRITVHLQLNHSHTLNPPALSAHPLKGGSKRSQIWFGFVMDKLQAWWGLCCLSGGGNFSALEWQVRSTTLFQEAFLQVLNSLAGVQPCSSWIPMHSSAPPRGPAPPIQLKSDLNRMAQPAPIYPD